MMMIVFIMFSNILYSRFVASYTIRSDFSTAPWWVVKTERLHAACIRRPVATEVGDVYVKIKGHPKEAMTVG